MPTDPKPKTTRFKLLAGQHYQNGQKYVAGQIVESPIDLVAKFGQSKFAREISPEDRAAFEKAVKSLEV